jgi:integrase
MPHFKPPKSGNKGMGTWFIRVPQRHGAAVRKGTGTDDKRTAVQMERMVAELAARREWELLEAVTGGDRRGVGSPTKGLLSLGDLFDVWRRNELEKLRARLSDVDVEPLVAEWYKGLTGSAAKMSKDTADHYLHAVRTLITRGKPFYTSRLTPGALQDWVDGMEGVEPGTVRKRGAGMRRFTSWLVKPRAILPADPMRDVELPPPGKPRCHYLTTEEAQALADAQREPYRTFSALLAGTGIEVSVALALTRRDVDTATREIRAAGTKNHNRDRIVRVAEWAWPYVEARCKGLLPSARLFGDIPDRWIAMDHHNEARGDGTDERPGLARDNPAYKGYTMRDARHTWAVRAVRSGWPIEGVARQLGHVDGTLALKVYGRFVPQQAERDRWERMAAERDAAQRAAKKEGALA